MKPKIQGNRIELLVIQNVYKTEIKAMKNKQGKHVKDDSGKNIKIEDEKFIRSAFLKTWFETGDISPYGEYIGKKGQTVKNRSMIFDRSSGKVFIVAHSVKELHLAINNLNKEKIGFKA